MMRLLVRFVGFLFAAGTVVFLVGVAAAGGLIWHFSRDLPDCCNQVEMSLALQS
jgi:penicillin-binding protein 1A